MSDLQYEELSVSAMRELILKALHLPPLAYYPNSPYILLTKNKTIIIIGDGDPGQNNEYRRRGWTRIFIPTDTLTSRTLTARIELPDTDKSPKG